MTETPKTPPPRTITDLAAEVGTTRRSVTRAKTLGMLPADMFVQVGKVQKVRPDRFDEAAAILETIVRPRTKPPTDPGFDYVAEKARREHYEAENARLRYLERNRDLLEKKAVTRAFTDAATRTRNRLLAIPRQLSAEAVGLDAGQIESLFTVAVRSALAELRTEVAGVELLGD